MSFPWWNIISMGAVFVVIAGIVAAHRDRPGARAARARRRMLRAHLKATRASIKCLEAQDQRATRFWKQRNIRPRSKR